MRRRLRRKKKKMHPSLRPILSQAVGRRRLAKARLYRLLFSDSKVREAF